MQSRREKQLNEQKKALDEALQDKQKKNFLFALKRASKREIEFCW